jgi:hypothetical protein
MCGRRSALAALARLLSEKRFSEARVLGKNG